MPLLTQYQTFFVSPFGEPSVCEELNHFLRAHRIINVEKRLVDGERGTGWLFLIEYSTVLKNEAVQSKERIDYRAILNDQEFALFDRLRQLRKELADQHGVPVYVIFTNEHLATLVKKPPKTEKDLKELPNVGEARVKQYGAPFLKLFNDISSNPHETPKSSL
ncbi:MAG TPA: hypothetical protein GXZ47_01995 [Treponema sp.]|nr:hypothetical protein [Treponema sp.]